LIFLTFMTNRFSLLDVVARPPFKQMPCQF